MATVHLPKRRPWGDHASEYVWLVVDNCCSIKERTIHNERLKGGRRVKRLSFNLFSPLPLPIPPSPPHSLCLSLFLSFTFFVEYKKKWSSSAIGHYPSEARPQSLGRSSCFQVTWRYCPGGGGKLLDFAVAAGAWHWPRLVFFIFCLNLHQPGRLLCYVLLTLHMFLFHLVSFFSIFHNLFHCPLLAARLALVLSNTDLPLELNAISCSFFNIHVSSLLLPVIWSSFLCFFLIASCILLGSMWNEMFLFFFTTP